MYILAAMLVLGLIANALVRPLADCWFRTDQPPVPNTDSRVPGAESPVPNPGPFEIGHGGFDGRTALAWTAVGLPIAWGVWVTLSQVLLLFSNRA